MNPPNRLRTLAVVAALAVTAAPVDAQPPPLTIARVTLSAFVEAPSLPELLADYLDDDGYRDLQLHLTREPRGRRRHPRHGQLSESSLGGSTEAQGQTRRT